MGHLGLIYQLVIQPPCMYITCLFNYAIVPQHWMHWFWFHLQLFALVFLFYLKVCFLSAAFLQHRLVFFILMLLISYFIAHVFCINFLKRFVTFLFFVIIKFILSFLKVQSLFLLGKRKKQVEKDLNCQLSQILHYVILPIT